MDLDKIPHSELYNPTYSPWLTKTFTDMYEEIRPYTLLDPQRCFTLFTLVAQAIATLSGEVWECGVYKGGTAMLLNKLTGFTTRLRLFDTFEGMPATQECEDWHKAGEFADTSLEEVAKRIPNKGSAFFYKGLIPETFKGLEQSKIAFAHIDVDIYSSVLACCEFIYPRLERGGFMVFDDYGWNTCPGAKKAVDEYFSTKSTLLPLILSTGQAIIFRS